MIPVKISNLSIVVPVYGCKNALKELVERIKKTLLSTDIQLELILVDDRCPYNSWSEVKSVAEKYPFIKAIRLSKNFGQHPAITAGLETATNEWIIVMDCDLQDTPEEIPKLINKASEGYDIVLASRSIRKDTFVKKTSSKLFYRILSYLTDTRFDHTIANFGIYNKKVINSILLMNESIRFFPLLVKWVGFKSTTVEVTHSHRSEGQSSYSMKRLINLGLDITLSFSNKPLKLLVKFGFATSFLSSIFVSLIGLNAIFNKYDVAGWASVIGSLWLIFGLMSMFLGMIGLYLGKTYDETKRRPIYIIDELISYDKEQLS